MLSIFRTNQAFANIFLLIYATLIRMPALLHDFGLPEIKKNGFLYNPFLQDTFTQNIVLNFAASTFLVFIEGTILNLMVNNLRMTREPNLLTGVFYILVCSLIPEFVYLNPILVANLFIIFAFNELFIVYKKTFVSKNLFNIGLLVGISFLIYKPYIFMILPLTIGIGVLRAFRFKERLMVLVGLFVPIFLGWTWNFWFDNHLFSQTLLDDIHFTGFYAQTFDSLLTAKLILFASLLTFLLFNYWNITSKKELSTRKYIDILFLSLFVTALTLLFVGKFHLYELTIFSIPLSYGLGALFINLNPKIADTLHFLLLFSIGIIFYLQGWVLG